jgi:hypothetical protein
MTATAIPAPRTQQRSTINSGRRLTKKLLVEPKKGLFYSYFYLGGGKIRRRRAELTVSIGPQMPWRPYLHWKVAKMCGIRYRRAPDSRAELAIRFDDATWSTQDTGALFPGARRVVNGACTDISKNRVGRVFESVFGYSCDLDPLTHSGAIVVKSNANAAHDGRVVMGPLPELNPKLSYQRVIDNEVAPGTVEDLRICVVGTEIPYLLSKRRPLGRRFENYTEQTRPIDPRGAFNEKEIELLLAFAKAFGLDFGEMDVVRDRGSQLIYVLDVNTTPHSPPDSLISLEGVRCMRRAAAAFDRQFLAGL